MQADDAKFTGIKGRAYGYNADDCLLVARNLSIQAAARSTHCLTNTHCLMSPPLAAPLPPLPQSLHGQCCRYIFTYVMRSDFRELPACIYASMHLRIERERERQRERERETERERQRERDRERQRHACMHARMHACIFHAYGCGCTLFRRRSQRASVRFGSFRAPVAVRVRPHTSIFVTCNNI